MEPRVRSPWIDYVSVFVFFVLVFLCGWQLWMAEIIGRGYPAPTAIAFIGIVFVAYLAADFLSGFVHFLGDSFGDEHTPLVGKEFIFPFREHHTDQKAITRHDFFETNGHNCLVSIPVLLAEYLFFPNGSISLLAFCVALFSFFLVFFVFCTNQFHKWAHEDRPNTLAQFLQWTGLILRPAHHKKHHTAPYDTYFCITTGWLNALLEKIHFFPFAKWVLAKMPGMPKVYETNKKSPA